MQLWGVKLNSIIFSNILLATSMIGYLGEGMDISKRVV